MKNIFASVFVVILSTGSAFAVDFRSIIAENSKAQTVLHFKIKETVKDSKIAAELSKKHLFMDSVTYENLKDEFLKIQMSTITVISTDPISNSNYFVFKPQDSKFSVTYWLHQKWCALQGLKTPNYNEMLSRCSESTWYQLLDHCVHLAEIDYQDDQLI